MKPFLLLSLILFTSLTTGLFAQRTGTKSEIQGLVVDSASGKPLRQASISLLIARDSSYVTGTITDGDGLFQLRNVAAGNYRLLITFLGYRNLSQSVTASSGVPAIGVGILRMVEQSNQLQEVVVRQESAPVTVKQDTLEFNAGSFKTQPNAAVEELLRKLPGLQVGRDGTIKAQGQTVNRVLVDGKPFFGNDPKMATRNLPADIVDKVQLYDQSSDQSQFSGIDDGNRERTINITLQRNKRKGYFGQNSLGLGTARDGEANRYQGRLNLNRFNNRGDGDAAHRPGRQISLIGQANNLNQQNFTLGAGPAQGPVFVGGPDGGEPFGSQTPTNVIEVRAGGLNYRSDGPRDKWGKRAEISTSYFLNQAITTTDQQSRRMSILPEQALTTDQQNYSQNQQLTHRFNLRLDWTLDSMTSLRLTPSLSWQTTDYTSRLSSRSTLPGPAGRGLVGPGLVGPGLVGPGLVGPGLVGPGLVGPGLVGPGLVGPGLVGPGLVGPGLVGPGLVGPGLVGPGLVGPGLVGQPNQLVNTGETAYGSAGSGLNGYNNLLLMRKFRREGRTLSFNLNTVLGDGETKALNQSVNTFYDSTGANPISNRLDQQNRQTSYNLQNTLTLSYTEPLSFTQKLEFRYAYSISSNRADRLVADRNETTGLYDRVNFPLSNQFSNAFSFHRAGATFQTQHLRSRLALGLDVQQSQLQLDNRSADSSQRRQYVNLLPNALFSYTFSRNRNLRLQYRTRLNAPSLSQLQPVIDNTNPLNVRVGNPQLAPEFYNTLLLSYNASAELGTKSFSVFASLNQSHNRIATSTTISPSGVQTTQPVNVGGFWAVNGSMSIGRTLQPSRLGLTFTTNVGLSRAVSFINDQQNNAKNASLSQGVRLQSNLNNNLEYGISGNVTYQTATYSLMPKQNTAFWSQYATADVFWKLPFRFVLTSDLTYTATTGRAAGYNQQFMLWNVALARQFFKGDQGELRLQVFDVLNQNRSLIRNTTDTYIEDVQSRILRRYLLVSFVYNLRKFGI
ncbi:outer membrane beta-barrel protein [Spirosoma sp. KNUC1025]|uniref:outer membrane beta-barrel protein n=1 Tax=Spirosoma sp. KNUC1025 TaxID=2894082 RepID=UPI0038669052|nr:TonB-dependent receptor [Spirosoma sp. KNUC1025]